MAELGQLGLHLPGLLSLLGEHLYSDPRVAFRELVQNAHDAVVRRRVERGEDLRQPVSVRCWQDDGRSWVSFQDAGLGLSRTDITDFLATIGRGQTREMRDAVVRDGVQELVGQFGVGLLAAFLVADQIRVRTRHADGGEGWEWVCEGQQTYRLDTHPVEEAGTLVILRIRPDRLELATPEAVRGAVRRYCGFLPNPITVQDVPLNARVPAWVDPDRGMEDAELASMVVDDSLAVLPLQDFTHPTLGPIELHGVLVIPAESRLSLREYGHLRVYIRHMLITERESDLLPRWARFVTGLIDCPQLEPTASREAIRRNALCTAVRLGIAAQLLQHLTRLQADAPDTWAAVVTAHSSLIKRDAIGSPALFEAVADAVQLPTSQGALTLPEIAERSGGVLYACTEPEQSRAMSLLLGAAGKPVIDARWYADAPFLAHYAELRGLPLIKEVPTVLEGALERASGEALPKVLTALRTPGRRVRASNFRPSAVPLFLIVPRAVRLQKYASEEAEADNPLAALLGTYAAAPVAQSTLLVNVEHPVLRAAEEASESVRAAVIAVLLQNARLVAGENLEHDALVASTAAVTEGLAVLMGGVDG